MATQIQFLWHFFPIALDNFSDYVKSVAPIEFDGLTCDDQFLTVVFNADVSQLIVDDITAHFNSLTASTEALKAAIKNRREDVNNLRDSKMSDGFTWNGHLYDSNELSRLNVTATLTGVSSGLVLPSTFTWRDANNVNVPMTTDEFKTFALSMFYWAQTIYAVSWYHKGNISVLSSADQVAAYNITVGW